MKQRKGHNTKALESSVKINMPTKNKKKTEQNFKQKTLSNLRQFQQRKLTPGHWAWDLVDVTVLRIQNQKSTIWRHLNWVWLNSKLTSIKYCFHSVATLKFHQRPTMLHWRNDSSLKEQMLAIAPWKDKSINPVTWKK